MNKIKLNWIEVDAFQTDKTSALGIQKENLG